MLLFFTVYCMRVYEQINMCYMKCHNMYTFYKFFLLGLYFIDYIAVTVIQLVLYSIIYHFYRMYTVF